MGLYVPFAQGQLERFLLLIRKKLHYKLSTGTLQTSERELKKTDYRLANLHDQRFSTGQVFSLEGSVDSVREFLVYLQIKKQEPI